MPKSSVQRCYHHGVCGRQSNHTCLVVKIRLVTRIRLHKLPVLSTTLPSFRKRYFLNNTGAKSVLFVISDGGPDHRLSYGTVQMSLLALFIRQNLDLLIAIRTCPYLSWTNLAKRVMSILNLALQHVSLVRKAMDEELRRNWRIRITLKLLDQKLIPIQDLAHKSTIHCSLSLTSWMADFVEWN